MDPVVVVPKNFCGPAMIRLIHKSKHDFSLATEIPARLRVYSGHPGEHFEDLQVLRCGEMFEIIHGVAYHIGFPDTASID